MEARGWGVVHTSKQGGRGQKEGGVSQIGSNFWIGPKWLTSIDIFKMLNSKKLIVHLCVEIILAWTLYLGTLYYRHNYQTMLAYVTDYNQECLGFYVIIWCSGTYIISWFICMIQDHGKPSLVLCGTISWSSAFADCRDSALLGIMMYPQAILQFLVVYLSIP